MDDLASREAPLEFWFWKTITPSGGAIVDFIVRRDRGEAELRVSTWHDGVRPAMHHQSRAWQTHAGGIGIEDARLDAHGSAGAAGGVRWDLEWDLGATRLVPRPAWFGPLHPFDMELLIRPDAELRGTLELGGRTVEIDGPGGVAHYCGRRLPARWTWISATGLDDDPDARLEALAVTSRIWGRRPTIPVGYVFLRSHSGVEGTVMPLTGVISTRREGPRVQLSSLRVDGRRHTIECAAPGSTFNDAGEGIVQSVAADLVLDRDRRATGSVGLEFRS